MVRIDPNGYAVNYRLSVSPGQKHAAVLDSRVR